MHSFSSKKLTTFLVVALKTRAISPSKQIKRLDMVTFLFSVHTITKAKQYAGQWIQPGHLTWRALPLVLKDKCT